MSPQWSQAKNRATSLTLKTLNGEVCKLGWDLELGHFVLNSSTVMVYEIKKEIIEIIKNLGKEGEFKVF
jgi:hypothetical protein